MLTLNVRSKAVRNLLCHRYSGGKTANTGKPWTRIQSRWSSQERNNFVEFRKFDIENPIYTERAEPSRLSDGRVETGQPQCAWSKPWAQIIYSQPGREKGIKVSPAPHPGEGGNSKEATSGFLARQQALPVRHEKASETKHLQQALPVGHMQTIRHTLPAETQQKGKHIEVALELQPQTMSGSNAAAALQAFTFPGGLAIEASAKALLH